MNRLSFQATSLIFLLLVCMFAGQPTYSQSRFFGGKMNTASVRNDRTEIYNDLLDLLFPGIEQETLDTKFSISLRFMPSFAPESQINIVSKGDLLEISESRSEQGNIYLLLQKKQAALLKGDVERLAKELKISSRTFKIEGDEARRLRRSLFEALSSIGRTVEQKAAELGGVQEELLLDGTTYRFICIQRLNSFRFVVYDHEVDAAKVTGESAIVRWFNELRLKISAMKTRR